MKLAEGMYVRTEYGISKIVNIFFEKTGTFIETDNELGNCSMATGGKIYNGIYILEEDYKDFVNNNIKENIIDLIQEGDYVNGDKVLFKDTGIAHNQNLVVCLGNDEERHIYDEVCVKSILTKEQFESMAYKVV